MGVPAVAGPPVPTRADRQRHVGRKARWEGVGFTSSATPTIRNRIVKLNAQSVIVEKIQFLGMEAHRKSDGVEY